jgi:aarF domain-containing kinase
MAVGLTVPLFPPSASSAISSCSHKSVAARVVAELVPRAPSFRRCSGRRCCVQSVDAVVGRRKCSRERGSMKTTRTRAAVFVDGDGESADDSSKKNASSFSFSSSSSSSSSSARLLDVVEASSSSDENRALLAPAGESQKQPPPRLRLVEIAKRVQLLVQTFIQCAAKYAQKDYDSIATAISRLGPTYVKFAQAAASRGDLVGPELAGALGQLQDDMGRFSDQLAIDTIREESPKLYEDIENIEEMLEKGSVAAASLCQVYKCRLKTQEVVAVKVQRPNIREQVEADAYLLRLAASYLEKFNLVEAKAVDAVDEFVSRLFEEMDFENEAENVRKFNSLYGPEGTAKMDDVVNGAAGNSDNSGRKSKLEIKVPNVYDEYTSKKVLVLEWIEGTPLTSGEMREVDPKDLPLVRLGIACTLSQLIETGVMHADPHGGNLIKLPDNRGLAYLDFGLVSTVPEQVRDGLVAAVSLMVFKKDYRKVANLFGELMLVPPSVLNDAAKMKDLEDALEDAANKTLKFPEPGSGKIVPEIRFDELLFALLALVPRFEFQLPPYFVNNARALGGLEGMARSADGTFNVLKEVYPVAIRRVLKNPNQSEVLRKTARTLAYDDAIGGLAFASLLRVLNDAANLTQIPRYKIAFDALNSSEGRRLLLETFKAEVSRRVRAILDTLFGRGKKGESGSDGISSSSINSSGSSSSSSSSSDSSNSRIVIA